MAVEDEDFKHLLGEDVAPLKNSVRVSIARERDAGVDKAARRAAAIDTPSVPVDPLSTLPNEWLGPFDEIAYCRPGVQHGVYKNVRLAKYTIDARLDLHRHTIEQARTALYRFMKDCVTHDVRFALITHGKSEGREGPARLKSCVAYWLPQLDDVLAFHSAQRQHGGYGATYVLLRKSDDKKLASKEQNRRKR